MKKSFNPLIYKRYIGEPALRDYTNYQNINIENPIEREIADLQCKRHHYRSMMSLTSTDEQIRDSNRLCELNCLIAKQKELDTINKRIEQMSDEKLAVNIDKSTHNTLSVGRDIKAPVIIGSDSNNKILPMKQSIFKSILKWLLSCWTWFIQE